MCACAGAPWPVRSAMEGGGVCAEFRGSTGVQSSDACLLDRALLEDPFENAHAASFDLDATCLAVFRHLSRNVPPPALLPNQGLEQGPKVFLGRCHPKCPSDRGEARVRRRGGPSNSARERAPRAGARTRTRFPSSEFAAGARAGSRQPLRPSSATPAREPPWHSNNEICANASESLPTPSMGAVFVRICERPRYTVPAMGELLDQPPIQNLNAPPRSDPMFARPSPI